MIVKANQIQDVDELDKLDTESDDDELDSDDETNVEIKSSVSTESDRPGMFNMAKIRRSHPELLYFFIPHKFKVKDISDFYKKNGRQNTLKFIKYYIKKIKL
jgi:hypothetical protein